MPHPIDRPSTRSSILPDPKSKMPFLLTRPRSRQSSELDRSIPPPPSPPKPQALTFFRTFSPRPVPPSDTYGPNTPETSPRAAARALRGWFGSPPSPRSGKPDEPEEYTWRYLDEGKEWEVFLRGVEDQGGAHVPLPTSPVSLRRAGEEDKDRRRRSDSKSSEWDAAIRAHARSLGYSCPSSPSELASNGSVESLASGYGSGSSAASSTHSPSMSLFSPSIRVATHYRPMRRRSSSYSHRETQRPTIASEDFVARYFAGEGPTEGSMLDGLKRASSKPRVMMDVPRWDETQSPEQQQQANALQLEVEIRPRRVTKTETLSRPAPAEPTFVGVVAATGAALTALSSVVAEPSLRSPRHALCPRPPSPASRNGRARSPTAHHHRTFRPSPLGPRSLSSSSVDREDDERWGDPPPADLETLREVWKGKRRRNTTDGLTTIWEAASHRECVFNGGAVEVGSEAQGRNIEG